MPSQVPSITIQNANDFWNNTDASKVCEKCGMASRCAKATPRQFRSIGSETPQVLFLMSRLGQSDVAAGRLLSEAAEFRVLDEAARAAGLQTDWHMQLARFSVGLRCPGAHTKDNVKMCRDITIAEILKYRPKLIVCVGKEAFTSLLPGEPIPVRGRVVRMPATLNLFSKTPEVAPTVTQNAAGVTTTATVPQAEVIASDFSEIRVMIVDEPWICLDDPGELEYLFHDFKKIPQILAGTFAEHTDFSKRKYQIVKDFDYAVQVLDYFSKLQEYSFDIECGPKQLGLEPYSKDARMLCVSFADPWRNAYCIPLAHKDSPLKGRLAELAPHLQKALQSSEPCGWNVKFDARWFYTKFGFETKISDDAMLMHGLLDENKPQKLKERAELDTDLGYYDEQLQECFTTLSPTGKRQTIPKDERCYEEHIPFDTLMLYCCADADACQQLRMGYKQKLQGAHLLTYYQTVTMPDMRSTDDTEKVGITIDLAHRETVSKNVTAKTAEVQQKLLTDPWLDRWRFVTAGKMDADGCRFLHLDTLWPSYSAFRQGSQPLFSFAYQAGWTPNAAEDLKKLKVIRKVKDKWMPVQSKMYTLGEIDLNPASPDQLQTFLYDSQFLGLKVKALTKKSKAPSTDQGVLKDHQKEFPTLGLLLEHRKLAKWKSTYLDPVCQGMFINAKGKEDYGWIKDDGLVHPRFLMTGNDRGQEDDSTAEGTVTGRKSCVEPNTQNIKKRGEGAKDIQKYFISRWRDIGGQIMQADFSQLELRVFACIAGISWMIGRYKDNADLHTELAMELFQKNKEEVLANDKFLRACAKEFWFGPIYGEGSKGIRDQLEKKMQLVWTEKQAEEALNRMYAKMPEYGGYKSGYERMLDSNLCVYTPFGRRRFLPTWRSRNRETRSRAGRQAGNFIIQSTGSDMLSEAWIILNAWSRRVGIKSRIIITVHDSLVWDVYPGELGLVSAATKYVMEHLPVSFVRKWPIPILADLDAGPSWGEMLEIVHDEKVAAAKPDKLLYLPTRIADPRFDDVVAICERMVA